MKSKLLVIIAIAVLSAALSLGTPAYADFQKGLDAYSSEDYATALKEWKPLAEQGNATAQYNLGNMYNNGQGVVQDYKEAVKWYRLAAEQGIAFAQFNLGTKYDLGQGVVQDDKEAVKWYRLAAGQGDADAQFNMGAMYAQGRGVIQDYTRAHMWFNISASQGQANAAKNRDAVAKLMTPEYISKAQDMARECVAKNYKEC